VLVVGYGMAGARLAEEIRQRDPDGTRVALTVLGAEPHPAYNRILLSSVVAGGMPAEAVWLHQPGWGRDNAVDLRPGTAVARIDRDRCRVELAGGGALGYDALVLATGSRPWIPPTAGLAGPDGALAPGVLGFRTLDDCRQISAAAAGPVPVAVLGGGLLGLEAARGLAGLGNPVTVVHPVGHLMERQLDPGAGGMLAALLAASGLRLRLGRTATHYLPGFGLVLDDGSLVEAGLVLVCAGVRPQTRLAREAGLAVRRGIVVDDELRTGDPHVHAIGDCAEHPGTVAGLVQPAWDQAAVLAGLLTGADPAARYRGTPAVTRLRASGVEVAAMGEVDPAPAPAAAGGGTGGEPEVLAFQDLAGGRYAKLVVRGGTVTGAVMLGLPDAAATVTQFFDQGIPAPADRLGLLLGRALPDEPANDPAQWPATTVVCRCNTVTKAHLVDAHRAGAGTVAELAARTRATSGCGSCREQVGILAGWLLGPETGPGGVPAAGTPAADPAPSASTDAEPRKGWVVGDMTKKNADTTAPAAVKAAETGAEHGGTTGPDPSTQPAAAETGAEHAGTTGPDPGTQQAPADGAGAGGTTGSGPAPQAPARTGRHRWIEDWRPEDASFWQGTGRRVAARNLIFSIFAEHLAFTLWSIWSVLVVSLPSAGFHFSVSQLFWLVSMPNLLGSALRLPYTFAVARFGGRNWTIVSTLLLLVPSGMLIAAVTSHASYGFFLLAAAMAGLGGGNFASSMANISYFYPESRKGSALGLNAAGGNIGVAVGQLLVPIIIHLGTGVHLVYAALFYTPLVIVAAACALLFMNNLHTATADFGAQAAAVRRSDTWVMSFLYIGTFGSFIGYSFALPLLIKTQFPHVHGSYYAWMGAMVGSLARPFGGWLSDRIGGARVTLWGFVAMGAAAAVVVTGERAGSFPAFFGFFLVLFITSGLCNGSTYRMIPAIFARNAASRAARGEDMEDAMRQARREAAAAIGIASSIGAFGGFGVTRALATSIGHTKVADAAFYGFIAFYAVCFVVTWWVYLRRPTMDRTATKTPAREMVRV
jgi:MFS transporter, NNP family, nitrate/nitrite transporter